MYHIIALLTVAIWGVTFVSTKVLISAGLEPAQIFALRFIMAYAGIWLLCLCRKEKPVVWANTIKDEFLFLLLGLTGGSLYFLTENTALKFTQACNTSFIVCSAPLITILLSILVRRFAKGRLADGQQNVQLNIYVILGTVLCLSGMVAVIFDGIILQLSPKGDLMALGASICWSVYTVVMGAVSEEYDTVFLTRKVFFYGLLTIIPFLFGKSFPTWEMLTMPKVLFNLVFLGLIASLLCFVLWNKVISKLGNVTATNYVYLNPFFTLVTAIVFLGESLTVNAALGCVAIVAGVAISSKSSSITT